MNPQINLQDNPQILKEFENYWLVYKPRGWFVHPPSDKRALKKFIQIEESSFQSRVTSISKIREIKPEPKSPKHDNFKAAVDGTYVHKHYIIMDFAPFWAAKR